jgi:hypothetical protein
MPGSASTYSDFSGAKSRASSSVDRLCPGCRVIDFDGYLGRKIEENVQLGSWGRIRQSLNCAFCRLVKHCLQADSRLTPRSPYTEVLLSNELSWKLGIELSPYDRSKSESYSNKFDLRSKASQCTNDAYRFVVFAKDGSDDGSEDGSQRPSGYIQYLADLETEDEDAQFFGRKVRPEKLDIAIAEDWLDRCSDWHGDECKRDRLAEKCLPSSLRLIDVKRRCIIKSPKDRTPAYVALSYVWGTEEMRRKTGMAPVLLLRRMIEYTAGEEATDLPTKIPRTIDDGITLTRWLGYRFLWVDALCIIQDDSYEEKELHLTSMKAIYSCASLTIVAAAGSHADHGIPGISVPRKTVQYSERVDGLRLATMFPSFSQLENSSSLLWNTRGWTFQEKLLSRRILLFTDFQVYFKCSESIWTEEVMMETERLSKSVEARAGKYRWNPNRERHVADWQAEGLRRYNPQLNIEDEWNYFGSLLDYTSAIQEYTKRTLTDPNDMMFAISGVLESMEGALGEFTLGLPQTHFLESLLWYPDLGSIQSYSSTDRLPSWTWASSTFARKGVCFHLMDVRQIRGLVMTSVRSFSNKKKDDSKSDGDEANPVWLAGAYGNLLASLAWPLLQKDHTLTQIFFSDGTQFRPIRYKLPTNAFNLGHSAQGHDLMAVATIMAERFAKAGKDDWKPSKELVPRDKYALVFKTVVVKFRIGRSLYRRMTDRDEEAGIFELLNWDDECVGEIMATHGRARQISDLEEFLTISWGLSLQHADVHSTYIPRWGFNSKPKGKSWFGKIVQDLSEKALGNVVEADVGVMPVADYVVERWGQYMPKNLKLDSKDWGERYKTTKFIHEVYAAEKGEARPRSLWPVVNLILVDWDGNMARRAGVGRVLMKAWQEAWNQPREVIFI